jgi:hypothetical protein
MSMELDKRLDLDIDTILESPKLRLQLSPAELDNRLLNFYNELVKGPGGDVIRLGVGGTTVGRQNLYMKKQAQKNRRRQRSGLEYDDAFTLPAFSQVDEITDERNRTPTQWVTLALRRNLPSKNANSASFVPKPTTTKGTTKEERSKKTTQMTMLSPSFKATRLPTRQWTSSPLI